MILEDLDKLRDGAYILSIPRQTFLGDVLENLVVVLVYDGAIKEIIRDDERAKAYLMMKDFEKVEIKKINKSYNPSNPSPPSTPEDTEVCINVYYKQHIHFDYYVISRLIKPNGEVAKKRPCESVRVWRRSDHLQVCLNPEEGELCEEGTYKLIQYTGNATQRPRIVIEIPVHNQEVGNITVHKEW